LVENVLKDDDAVYKALNPTLDFSLHNGLTCFLSEIRLYPGDCGPSSIEIYVSDVLDKWSFLRDYKCNRDFEQKISIPGEIYTKFIRIKCLNNVRGGNICSIRHIKIIGFPREYF